MDFEELQKFLNRRAPGRNDWSTARKEEDVTEFLSGLVDGCTCGAPIAATVCTSPVTVTGAEATEKSYPTFWEEYRRLGGNYEQHIR